MLWHGLLYLAHDRWWVVILSHALADGAEAESEPTDAHGIYASRLDERQVDRPIEAPQIYAEHCSPGNCKCCW